MSKQDQHLLAESSPQYGSHQHPNAPPDGSIAYAEPVYAQPYPGMPHHGQAFQGTAPPIQGQIDVYANTRLLSLMPLNRV